MRAPEPPAHLEDRARRKFTEIAEMLARCGVMTELDAGALARYAVIWCRWVDAEAEVKRRGAVVKTEGGNVIYSPFLAVANRCHTQLTQLEAEFGLTPSSRSRVRAASPPQVSDPIAESFGVDLVYVTMQKVRLVRRRDAGAVASLPVPRSNVAADNSPASSSWRSTCRAVLSTSGSLGDRALD
ncbi:MAG: phage terminase small subunit P27 family [Rhodoplanes sp.]